MRRKSKFTTFLLSFVPGLSHFYLGYVDRGFIYLIIFGMLCVSSVGLGILISDDAPLLIALVGVPIIWLVALIDAFSTINNMRYGDSSQIENSWESEEMKLANKKIITLALSMIPGAGHMYLGHQKKGLIFMGGFFFAIFFMGWLQLSFLLFLLPLIWFYSFFDAFHTLNGSNVEDIDLSRVLPVIKHEYIGMGLIGMGIFIALQKILYPVLAPYIGYEIRNYIQTSIVSLIFIIGGIKMLQKKKEVEDIEGDEEDEE
ncbi:hypothetical protein [Tissierella praeacuta]|uniref:hypothetical protein n=1 Tax=Tissierella praeacuta TaxID=43131 RepID=UPI0033428349